MVGPSFLAEWFLGLKTSGLEILAENNWMKFNTGIQSKTPRKQKSNAQNEGYMAIIFVKIKIVAGYNRM